MCVFLSLPLASSFRQLKTPPPSPSVPPPHMQVIQVARELPCYLNRQFITLLSTLEVPDEPIEGLHREMVETLDKVNLCVEQEGAEGR